MIKKQVTIEETIALLNEALALDPVAVSEMVSKRTPCNEALADHPTIQVAASEQRTDHKVGILGLINGLFGIDENGMGPIAAGIADDGLNVLCFQRARTTEIQLQETPDLVDRHLM